MFDKMMHYELISRRWNQLISHVYTNYYLVWNELVMNQLISFHEPNKKVRSKKIINHLIPGTKTHPGLV
jgi:hypothetical protein